MLNSLELLNDTDKKRLGNLIVEQIRERTQNGKGVTPSGSEYDLSSKPYSPSYAKKKGVSPNDVDLTLSGDMLENMFVKNINGDIIEISVRNRDYGKLRGAEEGIKRKTGLIKRPFFNLSNRDKIQLTNSDEFRRIFERATKRALDSLL